MQDWGVLAERHRVRAKKVCVWEPACCDQQNGIYISFSLLCSGSSAH